MEVTILLIGVFFLFFYLKDFGRKGEGVLLSVFGVKYS